VSGRALLDWPGRREATCCGQAIFQYTGSYSLAYSTRHYTGSHSHMPRIPKAAERQWSVAEQWSDVSTANATPQWCHLPTANTNANPPSQVKQGIILRRQIRPFSLWSFAPIPLGQPSLIVADRCVAGSEFSPHGLLAPASGLPENSIDQRRILMRRSRAIHALAFGTKRPISVDGLA
jgi:hypothetical protein